MVRSDMKNRFPRAHYPYGIGNHTPVPSPIGLERDKVDPIDRTRGPRNLHPIALPLKKRSCRILNLYPKLHRLILFHCRVLGLLSNLGRQKWDKFVVIHIPAIGLKPQSHGPLQMNYHRPPLIILHRDQGILPPLSGSRPIELSK